MANACPEVGARLPILSADSYIRIYVYLAAEALVGGAFITAKAVGLVSRWRRNLATGKLYAAHAADAVAVAGGSHRETGLQQRIHKIAARLNSEGHIFLRNNYFWHLLQE